VFSDAIVRRIQRGFVAREDLFREHGNYRSKFNSNKNSLSEYKQPDLRQFSERFLPDKLSYTGYINQLEVLLPRQYRDLFISYYYGGSLVHDVKALAACEFFDDLQASVVFQSLSISGRLTDSRIENEVRAGMTRLRLALSIGYPPVRSLTELAGSLDRLNDWPARKRLGSLSDAVTLIWELKETFVHLLGPDLFTALQQALDPGHVFDATDLKTALSAAAAWGCEPLFERCLALRRYRNLASDKIIAKGDVFLSPSKGPLDPRLSRIPVVMRDPVDRSLQRLSTLANFTDEIAGGATIEAILEAYNEDPSIANWIDWDTAYACISIAERMVGFKPAAFHLIVGQPFVLESFPLVNIAEGDGAFESALRAAVRGLTKKTLPELAAALKNVTGASRSLLVDAVLEHETSLVISGLIGYDPQWAKRLVEAQSLSFDARATAFRHDAAGTFLRHDLISADRAASVKSDAISTLRLAFLRGRQLRGLVHVRLDRAEEHLMRSYSDSLSLVRKLSSTPDLNNPEGYVQEVANKIAIAMTEHILLTGPDDVRTTISDTLRHGQLPNRFLQAFDKALTLTNPKITNTTKFYDRAEIKTGRLKWLIDLRMLLKRAIKKFNEENLTVTPRGRLYAHVRKIMELNVVALVATNSVQEAPTVSWRNEVEQAVEGFLSSARYNLNDTIEQFREELVTTTTNARDNNVQDHSNGVSVSPVAFRETLQQQLGEAQRDCVKWMAIAQAGDIDISFQDLVQLCLVTHSPSTGRPLAVTAKLSERRPGEGIVILSEKRALPGVLFEPIETICKNLIGNIFEHSGLGRDVRAEIELVASRRRMTIVSTNSVSVPRFRLLTKELGRLQSEVRTPVLSKAGEDVSSGFSKVAWACNRAFGTLPHISISLGTSSPTFTVSVNVVSEKIPF
jgi:hypothetical protein